MDEPSSSDEPPSAGAGTQPRDQRAAERRLVDRVLEGDREAFLQLIDQYRRLVQHVVYRMVDDGRDREELCQDVFVKVHRKLDTFRFESKLSTWIARIARNTCLNHLEKKDLLLYDDRAPAPDEGEENRSPLDRVPTGDPGPDQTASERDRRAAIREEIQALPEHYRTALTLYHLEGMSVKQVGAVMDNPEGTVKSHLHRARKKLKDRLLERFSREELS
jgi:RNA polymerase sigma-70 factor (ECF subfamily)